MKYSFPIIRNIQDVLPAIEGRDEFIVAERDGFSIIQYIVMMPDSFNMSGPDDVYGAIRRECRGMIFCNRTGDILRRPFFKFFNMGEREETQPHMIDIAKPHRVYHKLDGSMIAPFEAGKGTGHIRFGTKMGLSEVALQAEVFVAKNPKYMEFSKACIENGATPIFEWVSRDQTIVLDYPEDNLVLLAVRNMVTGEFYEI